MDNDALQFLQIKEMVTFIINNYKKLSSVQQKSLNKLLIKKCKFENLKPYFMPHNLHKLINAIMGLLKNDPSQETFFIELWFFLNKNLKEILSQFLTYSNKEIILSKSEINSLAEKFVTANNTFILSDVKCMLFLLNKNSKNETLEIEETPTKETKEIIIKVDNKPSIENINATPLIWDGWLKTLELLDDQKSEWDNIETFLENVAQIAKKKLQKRQLSKMCNLINEELNFLISSTAPILERFDLEGVSTWVKKSFDLTLANQLSEQIQKLKDLLLKYESVFTQQTTKHKEEIERINNLIQIDANIAELYEKLNNSFWEDNQEANEQALNIKELNTEPQKSDIVETQKISIENLQPIIEDQESIIETQVQVIEVTQLVIDSQNLTSESQDIAIGGDKASIENQDIILEGQKILEEDQQIIEPQQPIIEIQNLTPESQEQIIEPQKLTDDDDKDYLFTNQNSTNNIQDINYNIKKTNLKAQDSIIKTQTYAFDIKDINEISNSYTIYKPPQKDITSKQLANDIINGKPDKLLITGLVWRLILEDKMCFALHLSKGLEKLTPEFNAFPPSWLIRAVIVGTNIKDPDGELANLAIKVLALFSQENFSKKDDEWNDALNFLLIAAALKPALFAANTEASTILKSVNLKGQEEIYNYCKKISNYCNSTQKPFDFKVLQIVKDQEWKNFEFNKLRKKAKVWYEESKRQNMIVRVRKIWANWANKETGVIFDMIRPVIENDITQKFTVENLVKRFSDDEYIRTKINDTDKNLSRRNDSVTPVGYRSIIEKTKEAVNFAKQWLDVLNTSQSDRFEHNPTKELISQLTGLQDKVLAKLNEFVQQDNYLPVIASVNKCIQVVKDIKDLLDVNTVITVEDEKKKEHLLNGELLKIKALEFNSSWEPDDEPSRLINSIILTLAEDHFVWESIFDYYCQERDHELTGRIIEYIEALELISVNVRDLEQRRDQEIRKCREILMKNTQDVRNRLENGFTFGYVIPSKRNSLIEEIEHIENKYDIITSFKKELSNVEEIKQEIQTLENSEIEKVESRLEKEKINTDHPDYEVIKKLINKMDLLSANEYIGLLAGKQPLPTEYLDSFTEFFPETYNKIQKHVFHKNFDTNKLVCDIEDLGRGRTRDLSIGPINMRGAEGRKALDAAKMLKAWYSIKKSRGINQDEAKILLSGIGFDILSLEIVFNTNPHDNNEFIWINLTTSIISERSICCIPNFGSLARGNYRVLCVWGRPTEDELLTRIGDVSVSNSACIVLFFACMTEQRRQDLANSCRQKNKSLIVIDETILLYSCNARKSRLPVIFHNTIPFTYSEPFTTTSGEVPIEMFYGREQELKDIISPSGSCFIYGGRQLGKTVLLRAAEEKFHSPSNGRIAKWIDLKDEKIGYQSPIDDIWALLAKILKEEGVIGSPNITKPETLIQSIINWVNSSHDRKILLLLDEADRFLDLDRKDEFSRLRYFKTAMDKTHRNFKVIFAGLHKVLRTINDSNNSFAHFVTGIGGAIRIEPLFKNGGFKSARELIEKPFAELGYFFEPHLVTRILSQTNYYPSLIQLYCSYLLREVRNRADTVPYKITSTHLEEVYRNQKLREAIRYRFFLTLLLDDRYEVIAYIIAFGAIQQRQKIVEGFSTDWIKEQVLYWWEEGFRESVLEDILPVLLEEMEELGVLRKPSTERYTLRSPNLMLLMGTAKEIEDALLKSRQHSKSYVEETFRSVDRNNKNGARRSPLTVAQIRKLGSNGITVIFGCQASGLSYLEDSLKQEFGVESFQQLKLVINVTVFLEELRKIFDQRNKDVSTLVFVSSKQSWNSEWIVEASKILSKREPRKTFFRIVFVADSQISLGTITKLDDQETFKNIELSELHLMPWHDSMLHYWLDDCGFANIESMKGKEITHVTGNWSYLLEKFHSLSKPDVQHRWQEHLQELSKSLSDPEFAKEILPVFGLDRVELYKTLYVLAEFEGLSKEDWISIVNDVPALTVEGCISLSERLYLVKVIEGDFYEINPTVRKILLSAKPN